MSQRSISKNIARRTLIEGVVRGNRKGYAFLARADEKADLYLPRTNLHGAQSRDRVLCRIVSGDEAEVVKILERGVQQLVGTLLVQGGTAFVIPDAPDYFSDIYVENPPAEAHDRHKVAVRILDYDKGKNPVGEIVRVFGYEGEKQSEVLSILFGAGFCDVFPDKVEQAANALTLGEVEPDRMDLRELLTITIDGDDARDFDDAISIARTAGDGYELWVHIADVSHYVREGDVIDAEAYLRATSVYFPRRAYPMLPEALSTSLCSLVPDQDRFCLSCRMRFTSHGERKGVLLTKSVIHSDHRMTYRQVQGILQGDEALCAQYPRLPKMLAICKDLSDVLRSKRLQRGAIDFAAQETTVLFDGEQISGVVPCESLDSNNIIEDFMIAANEAVAETLLGAGYPCAYRVHDKPEEEKLRTLTVFASCFGLAPEKRYLSEKEICDFVNAVKETPYGAVISQVAIRCMQKAVYSPQNIGHYGLASECYCHFTSPIRRYPDLMVHRWVKRYLADKAQGKQMTAEEKERQEQTLQGKCMHCSMQERAAERAERDVVAYYQAVYMQRHVGEQFEAIVSGVTPNLLFATMSNGIEGCVAVEDIYDSFYFDPLRYSLVGQRNAYRIGDSVTVEVVSVDVHSHRIRLQLVGVRTRPNATIRDVAGVQRGQKNARNGQHGTYRTGDHKQPQKGKKRRR